MRFGKGYLRVHLSWHSDTRTNCLRCKESSDIVVPPIPTGPTKRPARDCHLQGVSDLADNSSAWFSAPLLDSLSWYIRATNTAFPHQQKKKVAPRRTPCSLCVRQLSRIERKLVFWVYGLILGAGRQGSMPPRRTRRNQGLRRYPTQKGSPDGNRFSGRNPIG